MKGFIKMILPVAIGVGLMAGPVLAEFDGYPSTVKIWQNSSKLKIRSGGALILNLPTSTGEADGTDYDISASFSLETGAVTAFVAFTESGANATLSIDGGTTDKALFNSNDASAVAAGDIAADAVVVVVYDGTQWQIISGNNSN